MSECNEYARGCWDLFKPQEADELSLAFNLLCMFNMSLFIDFRLLYL